MQAMANVKGGSRKERAQATRRRMMEAAYRVFSERGYAKTTMEAIAAEAGVAVQTLYFTFHTKAELLQAAFEHAVLGADDPTPPHLTEWYRKAVEEPRLDKAVALVVDGAVRIFERAAPLVLVAQADEDGRAAYEFNERLRADGYRDMLGFLADKQPLRKGLTLDRATDVMLGILGPQLFSLLTTDRGWTTAEYGAWAKGALVRELFSEAREPAPAKPTAPRRAGR